MAMEFGEWEKHFTTGRAGYEEYLAVLAERARKANAEGYLPRTPGNVIWKALASLAISPAGDTWSLVDQITRALEQAGYAIIDTSEITTARQGKKEER
jgi:hypothetical protein